MGTLIHCSSLDCLNPRCKYIAKAYGEELALIYVFMLSLHISLNFFCQFLYLAYLHPRKTLQYVICYF